MGAKVRKGGVPVRSFADGTFVFHVRSDTPVTHGKRLTDALEALRKAVATMGPGETTRPGR